MKLSYTLLVLPFLVACGSEPPIINSISVSPTEVPVGGETTLSVDISNFELRPPPEDGHAGLLPAAEEEAHAHEGAEGVDYPDGGHYHVYLDSFETNPLMTNCPEHCKHPAWDTMVRVKIPDDSSLVGDHMLMIRLNMDNHMFLKPAIEEETPLTITATTT